MATLRTMVIVPMDSAIPKDAAQNVWHFDVPAPDPAAYSSIQVPLAAFYNSLVSLYCTDVNNIGWQTKMYNLAHTKPRAPVYEATWNLSTSPSGTAMPHQVALVLSFQGDRVSGVPHARRRGRLYIGPLSNNNATTGGVPTAASVTTLANAATSFLTASDAAADWSWVVHSTVATAGQFDATVTNGWVDNSYDIQRRRKVLASSRTVWT